MSAATPRSDEAERPAFAGADKVDVRVLNRMLERELIIVKNDRAIRLNEIAALESQRDALREALKAMYAAFNGSDDRDSASMALSMANSALASCEPRSKDGKQ